MKTTKMASFTLQPSTIEALSGYSKIKSINKSALVDRLINEFLREEVTNHLYPKNEKPTDELVTFLKSIEGNYFKKG